MFITQDDMWYWSYEDGSNGGTWEFDADTGVGVSIDSNGINVDGTWSFTTDDTDVVRRLSEAYPNAGTFVFSDSRTGGWYILTDEEGDFFETCSNTANGQTDSQGYPCAYYGAYPDACSTFDTENFAAYTDCCECGGGEYNYDS